MGESSFATAASKLNDSPVINRKYFEELQATRS